MRRVTSGEGSGIDEDAILDDLKAFWMRLQGHALDLATGRITVRPPSPKPMTTRLDAALIRTLSASLPSSSRPVGFYSFPSNSLTEPSRAFATKSVSIDG